MSLLFKNNNNLGSFIAKNLNNSGNIMLKFTIPPVIITNVLLTENSDILLTESGDEITLES
jgi:hypothetical protein